MTEEQWEDFKFRIKDLMKQFVWEYSTSISKQTASSQGMAHGTGYYIQLGNAKRLLTNEHVARDITFARLGHLPGPTDDYIGFPNPFICAGWPIDIAITRLGMESSQTSKQFLQVHQFDDSYAPHQGELLFWLGFPGSRAIRNEAITDANTVHSWYGMMRLGGVPMLSVEYANPGVDLPDYDPSMHVLMNYPSRAQETRGGVPVPLPNPHGMSGSLLWDTKAVAALMANKKWSPEDARVCAIIWGAHEKPEVVVATKIEHVRPALLDILRQEIAYFHWLDRGGPMHDDWYDWFHAVSTLPRLK